MKNWHKVYINIENEGIEESIGVIIVSADPGCEPRQIAASAMLALDKAIFLVRGDGPIGDDPTFTTDELKEWLA